VRSLITSILRKARSVAAVLAIYLALSAPDSPER
jgi:hypothetical protein